MQSTVGTSRLETSSTCSQDRLAQSTASVTHQLRIYSLQARGIEQSDYSICSARNPRTPSLDTMTGSMTSPSGQTARNLLSLPSEERSISGILSLSRSRVLLTPQRILRVEGLNLITKKPKIKEI